MCPPDIVGNDVGEGLSFFNVARGKEATPDGLGAGEIGRFAVPETTVGRVGRDMLPHVLGETVPDPKDVAGSVNGIGHVHVDRGVLDVVRVPPEPMDRVGRANTELYKVENGG